MRLNDRLSWLLGSLNFAGRIHKEIYGEKFDINRSQISRDVEDLKDILKEYDLDFKYKGYVEGLSPELDLKVNGFKADPLVVLSDVLNESFVQPETSHRNFPEAGVLRSVVRSIEETRILNCYYISSSSKGMRALRPHSLVFVDGRLHCRAFEKGKGFRDYVLSRMSNCSVTGEVLSGIELQDKEWQSYKDIVLEIHHDDVEFSLVLAQEIGANIEGFKKRIRVREALLPYVLPLYSTGRFESVSYIKVYVEESND